MMVKRVFAILLAVMIMLSVGACAQGPIVFEFDEEKPWGVLPNSYEKATYSVSIMQRVQVGKEMTDGIELGAGELTYELSTLRSAENSTFFVRLVSKLSVSYYDLDENGVDRGLTDTVVSTVEFLRDGLGVLTSEKLYLQAPRRKSTQADAEFQDTDSYYYIADYGKNTAIVKKGQQVDTTNGSLINDTEYKNVKEFSLAAGNSERFFDNEQLFYAIRALKTTAINGSESLKVSNVYEISSVINEKGKYKNPSFAYSVNEALAPIELDESFAKNYLEPDENGKYIVNCLQVTVAKNDSEPGPAISLLITEPSAEFLHKTQGHKTKKLITRIKTVQYDLGLRVEKSNIIYSLVDYTVEKEV